MCLDLGGFCDNYQVNAGQQQILCCQKSITYMCNALWALAASCFEL